MEKVMTRKIYVVGGDTGYASWCKSEIVRNMEEANLVMFTGGADVSPYLYKKRAHPTIGSNPRRDFEEITEFENNTSSEIQTNIKLLSAKIKKNELNFKSNFIYFIP